MKATALYIAVLCLLSGLLALTRVADTRVLDTLQAPLDTIRDDIAGWHATNTGMLSEQELSTVRPTAYLLRRYARQGEIADVYIAYYAAQQAGEGMHSPRVCLPGSGWEILKAGSVETVLRGQPVSINRYSIRNGQTRLAALYWYQSRKRVLANEYMAKLMLLQDAILEGRTAGALVRIATSESAAAQPQTLEFAAALMDDVQRCLGR